MSIKNKNHDGFTHDDVLEIMEKFRQLHSGEIKYLKLELPGMRPINIKGYCRKTRKKNNKTVNGQSVTGIIVDEYQTEIGDEND